MYSVTTVVSSVEARILYVLWGCSGVPGFYALPVDYGASADNLAGYLMVYSGFYNRYGGIPVLADKALFPKNVMVCLFEFADSILFGQYSV